MQTTGVFMMSLVGPFSFFLVQERCIMGTFYRVPHHVLKRGFARHRTTSGDGECWEKGGLANNGGKRWTANKQVGDAFLCRFAWRTPSFTGAVWGRGLVISAVYLTIFDVARQCITRHIKKLKKCTKHHRRWIQEVETFRTFRVFRRFQILTTLRIFDEYFRTGRTRAERLVDRFASKCSTHLCWNSENSQCLNSWEKSVSAICYFLGFHVKTNQAMQCGARRCRLFADENWDGR